MRTHLLALIVLGLPLSCTRLAAQEDSCLGRVVPVNVVTSRGSILSDLSAANFRGSLHGKPVKVLSVTPDDSPRRLVIALDASGSMTDIWGYAVQIAFVAVNSMHGDDAIGIMTFSQGVKDQLPPTIDRGRITAELERLAHAADAAPKGRTSLWDALAAAAREFGPPRLGDSVFVITDGRDNASKSRSAAVRDSLLEEGIRAFFLTIRISDGGPTPEEDSRMMDLPEYAGDTGGLAVSLEHPLAWPLVPPPLEDKSGKTTEAKAALLGQLHMIQTVEKLEIELPERPMKMEEWKLNVTGIKDAHSMVLYPHKLAACSTP